MIAVDTVHMLISVPLPLSDFVSPLSSGPLIGDVSSTGLALTRNSVSQRIATAKAGNVEETGRLRFEMEGSLC